MSTHRHWGDLPAVSEPDGGVSALQREQMSRMRSLDVEGPRLHQPSSKHCPPADVYPAELFSLDSLTLHTIKLVQHARQMRALIQQAQQLREHWKPEEGDVPSYSPAPPIPEYPGPPKLEKMKPFPFLPKNLESDFVRGMGKPPPEIDGLATRKLLKKSVAAVCAATGFDNCAESVLDTLTDVTHEYMEQMTRLLRVAVDNEATRGYTGFPDAIQQVFHEMGIGKLTTVHDFYQTRVVRYHDHMLQECQQLMDEYQQAQQPDYKPSEPAKSPTLKVKEEPGPDIHFPLAEDVEEILGPDGMINLEGLGLDMSTVQDSSLTTEEETKWLANVKTEPADNKGAVQQCNNAKSEIGKSLPGVSTLDDYDTEEGAALKADTPHTPTPSGESADNLPEPGSVPGADIMSPPSSGIRPPKAKKKKKGMKNPQVHPKCWTRSTV